MADPENSAIFLRVINFSYNLYIMLNNNFITINYYEKDPRY